MNGFFIIEVLLRSNKRANKKTDSKAKYPNGISCANSGVSTTASSEIANV